MPLNVPNLEPPMRGKRPDFYVPAGTVNLAKNKKVTSSDSNPNVGTLDMIVDGDKDGKKAPGSSLGRASNGFRSIWAGRQISTPSSSGIFTPRRASIAMWWCRSPTIQRLIRA